MAEITVASIDAKLAKGEKLTPEENKFVMSMPPSGVVTAEEEAEEGIDWSKAENMDAPPKEKVEETPEAKSAREAKETEAKNKAALASRAKALGLSEEAKEEEIVAAEAKKKDEEDQKDPFVKIERELQKPEGQEKLEGFTDREKAYFYQMRRDRRARQKAEEERDKALFREVQLKSKIKPDEKPEDEDPLAILKGKEPTDFMTVADVIKVVEKITAAPKSKVPAPQEGVDPVRLRFLKMCDAEARTAHPEDYDAVMELTSELVNTNPEHLKKIAQAISGGENPAEVTYAIIKSDPEFANLFPGAQVKVKARDKKPDGSQPPQKSQAELDKEKKAQEAQEAMEKNKSKIKTSAHASGEVSEHSEGFTDGKVTYTTADLVKMSDLQFARVPKKIREAFLRSQGV